MNRLTLSKIGSNTKVFEDYAIGNMINKPDVSASAYQYPLSGAGSVRSHAVSAIGGIGSFV